MAIEVIGAKGAIFTPENNIFKRGYYSFGYLPMLLVLDEYESREYYMTCFLIKNALDEVLGNENLPTRYGVEALEATKKDFEQRGWSDKLDAYLNNVPMYTVELKKYIEKNFITYKY